MRLAGAENRAGSKPVKTTPSRRPRESARRGFSPRGAVFASALRGRADPQECHYPTWVAGWPSGAMPRSSPSHPRGRAEPARPRGGKPTTDGLAGEGPEMTRKVVFSVGCALRVRVARPYVRRDIFIFTPCVDDDSAAKGGQRWSWRCAILVGVRSPPLRGGRAKVGWPCREKAGDNSGVVFSEGCALRVRVGRPYVCRGISFAQHALTMNRWPREDNTWVGVVPSFRACGARPSAGRAIQGKMALRRKARDAAEGGFLGGARSPRPHCKAVRTPRHFISTT
jgi:hypothetical protein